MLAISRIKPDFFSLNERTILKKYPGNPGYLRGIFDYFFSASSTAHLVRNSTPRARASSSMSKRQL